MRPLNTWVVIKFLPLITTHPQKARSTETARFVHTFIILPDTNAFVDIVTAIVTQLMHPGAA